MKPKKIIPCLDMKDGRVVKGKKFIDFTDAGDPVKLAKAYCDMGADEIAFLDISASLEGRKTMLSIVEKVAKEVSVPFCVGGGISEIDDITRILERGANKISINSAAVKNPAFLKQAIEKYGSQIVLAVDAKENGAGGYNVYIDGGLKDTGIDVIKWVKEARDMGLSEILLTSIDADGIKTGYDLKLTKLVKDETGLLVTASGGCGKLEDFRDAFTIAGADAALAASLFHFNELTIGGVKDYLRAYGFCFTKDIDILFEKSDLIPTIIQDNVTKEVLMLAYCNKESLQLTLKTGLMHYYSRSRQKLWKKGETSGNTQKVQSIYADCDNDTLLCTVEQKGVACHTGNKTCFFNKIK